MSSLYLLMGLYALLCAAFGAVNVLPAGTLPEKTKAVMASSALFLGIGLVIGCVILRFWLGILITVVIYVGITVLAGRITVSILRSRK